MGALIRFAVLLSIGWICFGLGVAFLYVLRVATDALSTMLGFLQPDLMDPTLLAWPLTWLFLVIGLGRF